MLIRVVALKFSVCPFRTCPLYKVVPFESETNNHELPRTAETLTDTPVPEEYVSRTTSGVDVSAGDGCSSAVTEVGVLQILKQQLLEYQQLLSPN